MSVTQTEIVTRLAELSRLLDKATVEIAELDESAVRAKSAYEITYARAFLQAEGAMDARKQIAVLAAADQRLTMELAEAQHRACRERIRTLGVQIDVGRSMSAAWGRSERLQPTRGEPLMCGCDCCKSSNPACFDPSKVNSWASCKALSCGCDCDGCLSRVINGAFNEGQRLGKQMGMDAAREAVAAVENNPDAEIDYDRDYRQDPSGNTRNPRMWMGDALAAIDALRGDA